MRLPAENAAQFSYGNCAVLAHAARGLYLHGTSSNLPFHSLGASIAVPKKDKQTVDRSEDQVEDVEFPSSLNDPLWAPRGEINHELSSLAWKFQYYDPDFSGEVSSTRPRLGAAQGGDCKLESHSTLNKVPIRTSVRFKKGRLPEGATTEQKGLANSDW
jgi:hypothetical protein